jgi:4-hydroxy-2-oxoheptanedioate aldolase
MPAEIKGSAKTIRHPISRSEFRNSKHEIQRKPETRKYETNGIRRAAFLSGFCLFCDFEFPSDFGFRASDFKAGFGNASLANASLQTALPGASMTGYDVRQALRSGRRVYASAMVSPSPLWPKWMSKAGIDFVFIDSEHTPLGREPLSWICQSFSALGVPPVVRIPCPDPFEACKVLDGGAGGVIAPYVETPEQVRQLQGVAWYRPLKGQRLQDALRDPNTLEPELREYLGDRNQHTILIANIESVPAIRNLDEILALGALDSVLIGPHDLSCSLGVPEQYSHPKFIEAVGTIFKKARAHNVGAGLHWWRGVHDELEWARLGANLFMHSTDITLAMQHLTSELAQLRANLGDAGATRGDSVIV